MGLSIFLMLPIKCHGKSADVYLQGLKLVPRRRKGGNALRKLVKRIRYISDAITAWLETERLVSRFFELRRREGGGGAI